MEFVVNPVRCCLAPTPQDRCRSQPTRRGDTRAISAACSHHVVAGIAPTSAKGPRHDPGAQRITTAGACRSQFTPSGLRKPMSSRRQMRRTGAQGGPLRHEPGCRPRPLQRRRLQRVVAAPFHGASHRPERQVGDLHKLSRRRVACRAVKLGPVRTLRMAPSPVSGAP